MRLKETRSSASRFAARAEASEGRCAPTRAIRSPRSRSLEATTLASTMATFRQSLEISIPHPFEPGAIGLRLEDGSRAPASCRTGRAFVNDDAVTQEGLDQRVPCLAEVDDVHRALDGVRQIGGEPQQVQVAPEHSDIDVGVRTHPSKGGGAEQQSELNLLAAGQGAAHSLDHRRRAHAAETVIATQRPQARTNPRIGRSLLLRRVAAAIEVKTPVQTVRADLLSRPEAKRPEGPRLSVSAVSSFVPE